MKFIAPRLVLKWEHARGLNPSEEEEDEEEKGEEEEVQRPEDINYPLRSQITLFRTLMGYKCVLQWFNCPLF